MTFWATALPELKEMRTDPRRLRAVDPNGRPRDPTSWLCILYRIECANSNTIALNTSLGQEMPNVMRTHIDTEYDNQTGGLTRERYLTSQITPPIASAWKPLRWAKRRSSRAARKTLTEQIPNFGHWATKHPGGRSGERKREHAKMAQAASSNRARAVSVT